MKQKINVYYSSSNHKSNKSNSINTSKGNISFPNEDYINEKNLYMKIVDLPKNFSLYNIKNNLAYPHSEIWDQRNLLNQNSNYYSVPQNNNVDYNYDHSIHERESFRNDQCVQTNLETIGNVNCRQYNEIDIRILFINI